MDDLIKALHCAAKDCRFGKCEECEYNQKIYPQERDVFSDCIQRISNLEKSNRNWRRKCQRLRKKSKEIPKPSPDHGLGFVYFRGDVE